MWSAIFEQLNFIKIFILLTFIFGSLNLKSSTVVYKLVFVLVAISLVSEITNSFLIYNKKTIGLSITIYVVIHQCIWLLLLEKSKFINYNYRNLLLLLFLIFAMVNLLFFEKQNRFNYHTFVFGAIIYLTFFAYKSYNSLKKEELTFFETNNYTIMCAPVLFFIGLSFMFGFKSKEVTSTLIFGSIKLFTFITYAVNICYYSIINLYIYKELKLKNAR